MKERKRKEERQYFNFVCVGMIKGYNQSQQTSR
jgi:hypothetical protein